MFSLVHIQAYHFSPYESTTEMTTSKEILKELCFCFSGKIINGFNHGIFIVISVSKSSLHISFIVGWNEVTKEVLQNTATKFCIVWLEFSVIISWSWYWWVGPNDENKLWSIVLISADIIWFDCSLAPACACRFRSLCCWIGAAPTMPTRDTHTVRPRWWAMPLPCSPPIQWLFSFDWEMKVNDNNIIILKSCNSAEFYNCHSA